MKIKNKNQKGVSILLTLLVMTAFLSIALWVSKLGLAELKISRDAPQSLIAYYAAEAGVECQMFNDRLQRGAVCGGGGKVCLDAGQQICYQVQVSGATPNRTIESTGSYKQIKRAVELSY